MGHADIVLITFSVMTARRKHHSILQHAILGKKAINFASFWLAAQISPNISSQKKLHDSDEKVPGLLRKENTVHGLQKQTDAVEDFCLIEATSVLFRQFVLINLWLMYYTVQS